MQEAFYFLGEWADNGLKFIETWNQNRKGGNMGGKGALRWFRLGLAAALASICLCATVIARAQGGPSWEVPVAVMEELRTFPLVALALAIFATVIYLWGRGKPGVGASARSAFGVVLLLAFVFPVSVWLLQPEQWPFRFVTLSLIATVLVAPIWIAAVVYFWLIGWRWARVG